jgi:hypothetical protein
MLSEGVLAKTKTKLRERFSYEPVFRALFVEELTFGDKKKSSKISIHKQLKEFGATLRPMPHLISD